MLATEEGTLVHDGVVQPELLQRAILGGRRDDQARVVDEHMQRTEFSDGAGDDLLPALLIAHIVLHEEGAARAARVQFGHQSLALGDLDVRHDDLRALAHQGLTVRPSESLRAARHDGDLALYTSHGLLLSVDDGWIPAPTRYQSTLPVSIIFDFFRQCRQALRQYCICRLSRGVGGGQR